MLIHLGLFTGSFYAVDNLHLLIVVTLLSFGTGHAIFRSKFGFITLAFLSLFIYFIYFQIQGAQWSIIAIVSFIVGVAYAYRESSEGMLDDWRYRAKEFLASIKGSAKQSQASSQSYENADSYQQAYEAEQARREQEAKAQRQQQKNQNEQQEESRRKQENPKQERAKQQYQRQQNQNESIEKNKPVTDTRTNLEILGLQIGFTQEELKKAYKRRSMKVHPDRWRQEPESIQETMEEEFKILKKAYEQLKS